MEDARKYAHFQCIVLSYLILWWPPVTDREEERADGEGISLTALNQNAGRERRPRAPSGVTRTFRD